MHFNNTSSTDIGKVPQFDIDGLRAQQSRMRRHGQLYWVHWLMVALTLAITLFAWKTSESALHAQERLRFDRQAESVINLMRERISHYEDALLSGVAAIQSHNGIMSRSQWQTYSSYLDLTQRYPGTNGIGLIRYVKTEDIPALVTRMQIDRPDFAVHPEHHYDLSLPIVFIEPESENLAAVGLDVAFETNRRSAALFARTYGETQISGPIALVQDNSKTPGFLFYAPYYDLAPDAISAFSDEDRERQFRGLVYAPLVFRNLVEGVLSAQNRQVNLTVRDGNTVLFSEPLPEQQPLFHLSTDVDMHGRTWTFDIHSQPASLETFGLNQPTVVLISGLCLDTILIALFWIISRSNRRSMSLAESMTNDLAEQAQALSENNRDLESFARVVSHDLKTPLRNIHSVISIMDEDHGQFLASNDEGQSIKGYLDTLQDQATRGQSLIGGILDYAKLGSDTQLHSTVDTRQLIASIAVQNSLRSEQMILSGTFPVLLTNATLLEQVLSNLIGNAVKYGPEKVSVMIKVSVREEGDHYYFSIEDNGIGISEKYHERIFLPFHTLSTEQDIHSSGIGLSIVHRALELQGGTIEVESVPGEGSTFTFSWPATQTDLTIEENRHVA